MEKKQKNTSQITSIAERTAAIIKKHRRFKNRRSIVAILAIVVLLTSGYSMVLPAATMAQQAYCGYEEHTHGDECYDAADELSCTLEDTTEAHEHSENCYEKVLLCNLEEHTHSLECYSNPEADVESQTVWERSLGDVQLTGVWADDLVNVAESQLGYKESQDNYLVEGGNLKGYTRYGAWYGDAYADWNGIFVSFCLNYAEIPEEDMPRESGISNWFKSLSQKGMYEAAGEYEPQKGDLVFFLSEENADELDRVGIIAEVINNKDGSTSNLRVIEGDARNEVVRTTYEMTDSHMAGYGVLPQNAEEKENAEEKKEERLPLFEGEDLTAITTEELEDLLEQTTAEELQAYLESLSDDQYDNLMENLTEEAQEIMTVFLAGAALTPSAAPLADPPIYYQITTETDDEGNSIQVLHLGNTPYAGGGVYTSGEMTIQNTFSTVQKSAFSKIVLDNEITAPRDCTCFLSPYKNVTEIVNLDNLNTSQTTNMRKMFGGCERLRNIDVSGLNTGNVTDMSEMFANCNALESINGLDKMDVKKVTTMSKMFYDCNNLSTIDLSGFKTDSLTNTSEMFTNCKRLSQIHFGDDFDTSKVTDMSAMFAYCITITAIDVSNFDTGAVENMAHMFSGCRDLETLDVSGFDTSSVTDMRGMFGSLPGAMSFGCESLKSLDLSGWNTSAVTDMSYMFSDCNSLTELDLSSFDTGNVTNMKQMFFNCEKLAKVDVSSFDTSNVTNMNRMFGTWAKLTVLRELDLSNFDTSNVTDMEMMFYKRTELQRLDISGFVITEGTNVDGFLVGDENLAELKTPASVDDSLAIPLPKIMVNEDDHSQIFGRMPKLPDVTGSLTLIPYETSLLTEGSESTLLFKKYLDGELVNDPQRSFEFGVFKDDGTDTGIRVNNNLIGNIAVETENLPLGRYYVQEIAGTDQIIYDNVRYYFTIEEETISTEIVYPSTEVVYLPIDEDYLDTTKYDLVANGLTVTAYEKGTQNPVKTLRAFCADKSKGLTYGSVGATPNSVYLNPTEDEINIARGYVYTGPNQGELADAIKCVLFFGDRYEMQEEIWGLLNYGVDVDTSRVGEIPAGFKWAIIQQPRVNVQPLIVPLWTTEDRDVYDNVEGDSMTRRTVKLETTDIEFNNRTLPENAVQVQIPVRKMIDNGTTPIGKNQFKFKLSGNGMDVTVENYSNGEVVFPTIVLTEPGTYTYTIEELTDGRDGVFFDFDHVAKTVTVVVSDDYEATVNITGDEVVFNNTTCLGNRLTIGKTVTGIAGDRNRLFNFSIDLWVRDYYELNGTFDVVPGAISGVEAPDISTITFNNGHADVQLKHGQNITITGLPDGYVYTVTEDEWNMDGYTSSLTQDPSSNYDLYGDGYYNADDTGAVDVEFKNQKEVFRAEITAEKTLDGGLPAAGQFTFILKDADGNEVARKTNDGNGDVTFPLTFTKAGEYTYTIEELNGGNGTIVYDTSVKTVKVIVGDGENKLQVINGGSAFYGSRVGNQFYVTVDGATELNAYNLYLNNDVYDNGTYNNKIVNPALNDIQYNIGFNYYGEALSDNLRKLMYYFDTHNSEDKIGQNFLTRQFRQELIWCLSGIDDYRIQSHIDAIDTIIAQSAPPDDYTVVLFKSNRVRTRPLLVGCLPTSVTFQDGDDTFENTSRQYELPETGGKGTTGYTLGGLLILCSAAVLMYIYKLERRKGGNC